MPGHDQDQDTPRIVLALDEGQAAVVAIAIQTLFMVIDEHDMHHLKRAHGVLGKFIRTGIATPSTILEVQKIPRVLAAWGAEVEAARMRGDH